MTEALRQLIDLLDLEPIEVNIFRGKNLDETRQRVFGGQVAAQSLVAAGRTVDSGRVHSLHSYFLRPGDPSAPILYEVDRIRDGRSFTTRRVVAIQHGHAIFNLQCSFHIDEGPGLVHQATMPDVPRAEDLADDPRAARALRGPAAGVVRGGSAAADRSALTSASSPGCDEGDQETAPAAVGARRRRAARRPPAARRGGRLRLGHVAHRLDPHAAHEVSGTRPR